MNFKHLSTNFSINAILDKSAPERKTVLDKMLEEKKETERLLKKFQQFAAQESFDKLREQLQMLNAKIKIINESLSIDYDVSPGFVLINPGSFVMGSDKYRLTDNPMHKVRITIPFEMAKYPVTQEDFLKFIGDHQFLFPNNPKNPAEKIRWQDAVRYCRWRSIQAIDIQPDVKKKAGFLSSTDYIEYAIKNPSARLYRLPTDAEWEYACSEEGRILDEFLGRFDRKDLDEYAVNSLNNDEVNSTLPVGSRNPNGIGLYDMLGNVCEWCAESSSTIYVADPTIESIDPCNFRETGLHIARGGAWNTDEEKKFSRAYRFNLNGDNFLGYVGFRLVRSFSLMEQI